MIKLKRCVVPLIICTVSLNATAEDLSFLGVSGVLVTPDAHLLAEGNFSYQYNNYIESRFKANHTKGGNHVFSIGLSRYVEIGGRLTDYKATGLLYNPNGTQRGKRDLSGNIKIRLPKLAQWMPDIALGVNDFGGEAVNFESQYAVATKSIGKLDFSVGYAKGDNQSFDGAFSSVKYALTPNLSLRAEYDSKVGRLGAHYDLSSLLHLPLSIKIATPVSGDNTSNFIGIDLALAFDGKKRQAIRKGGSTPTVSRQLEGSEAKRVKDMAAKLAKYGFENIKIGRMSSGKYVLFVENRVFNHSMIDALGVALGTAHEFIPDDQSINIVLTQQGHHELSVETKIGAFSNYLKNTQASSVNAFKSQLVVGFVSRRFEQAAGIKWFNGITQGDSPRVDIKLSPAIANSVGHEWGVYDYSLALQTDVKVNLWKGGNALFSGQIPLHASEEFKADGVFNGRLHEKGLKQVLIQQYIKPTKQLSALASLGKVEVNTNEYNTAQVEARWMSEQGNHQFSTHLAYFDPKDKTRDKESLAIGSYEYHPSDSNWSAEISQGQFFKGDAGMRVRLKKHFADTVISPYINYINKKDISGGLSISMPLTPRKDYKNKYFTVRGEPDWNYSLGTTIKDPVVVGSNRQRPYMMFEPKLANNLSGDYLDSNRLTPQYVISNIKRLREAYYTLRQ